MPLYTYKNVKTGEVWEELKSMSEHSKFLSENNDIEQCFDNPVTFIDPMRLGRQKVQGPLRDKLSMMKRYYHGSTITSV